MFKDLDFKKGRGLIPAIIQEEKSGRVLMLGYMNKEAYRKTLKTGLVHFWSRGRQKLWLKGEESGNKLKVKEIVADCDNDTLLIKAKLLGKMVCHTGSYTCFLKKLDSERK
jgi:phosphoribosyl-AMP cyclohydrolase